MKYSNARGPAYRIHTARLILRCMNPEDAELFQQAVEENTDHLRPWMSWMRHEPRDLDAKMERLRELRSNFDGNRDFVYGLFDREESRILGATGLQTRQGEDAREVSFWVHREYNGRGFATEVASSLVRVAFEVDKVRRVELHCDPRNTPSARIAEKLGFSHEATLKERQRTAQGKLRDTMIWTLFEEQYRQSPARDSAIEAYDALGRRLL